MNKELREFYLSSPMRKGVLCWYPFAQCTSALDLSNGVLTELLSNRTVAVCVDEHEKVDYIIALDPKDFSLDTLKSLKERLNPKGRLLIAYENPFALRFWAGMSAPNTGCAYDTLFGIGDSPLPSKAELQIRLKNAGFKGQKWYYLSPDHLFVDEVYSENYMPNEFMNQRLIPYIANDKHLQFDERLLYREVIRGGAFEFMCGGYLVEARNCADSEPCIVDYAAVTAFRDAANRFATTIRNDGMVYKIPLHADGAESVLKTHRNHEDLAKLGINVVKTSINGNSLVMDYVDLPTLWDYWALKLSKGDFDENKMFTQFDRIREDIYKASVNGRCYWELVPANCFYNEKTDEIIYFDQEHFYDDISPDVAVVRALWSLIYSDAIKSDPRTNIWLEELKKRYGLIDRWEELAYYADVKPIEMLFYKGEKRLKEETKNALRTIAENKSKRDS